MKKIISFAIFLTALISYSYAQDSTTVLQPDAKTIEKYIPSSADSLYLQAFYDIKEQVAHSIPRFKLYKTDNLYNLILLDTATGKIWQVQYGMNNDSNRMKVPIDDTSLVWRESGRYPGRFELYPTNNMYTFILVDNETGATYQVQWNTSSKKRFRTMIY